MPNRLQMFVVNNIGIEAVNVANSLNKVWRRLVPSRMMDMHSLEKFKQYKNDWIYPVQVGYQEPVFNKDKQLNTFLSATRATVMVGQCFGLNPVLGINGNNVKQLRFKYKSWRFVYASTSIMGQFIIIILIVISLFYDTSSTVDTATAIIFFCFGILTPILFLRISKKWPKLCRLIANVEETDPNTDTNLDRKLNISCAVVLTLAFLEHGLSELHGLSIAMDCYPERPIYEAFIRHTFSWIFAVLPYSNFVGFLIHFWNFQSSFYWNYSDLFVICMSTYLFSRLEQVNNRVLAAKDQNLPSSFWRTLREDYNKNVQLVLQVDQIIGGVVFVSFACNLFFVCLQLMHTLADGFKAAPRCGPESSPDNRLFRGYEHPIYFAYSFVFLLARAITVSLTAAKVHAASLETAFYLYDVPSTTYCIEIKRFLDQLHGDTVALSGLQFFQVSRGIILTIAGTILTYELVLLQFTGASPSSPESQ